jgi:hypothetical protein
MVYVEELTLSEFGAIEGSTITFVHPMSPDAIRRELPNVNLLVGSNGGGKSTVLKGIVAAALARFVDLEELTDRKIHDWPRIGAAAPCSARAALRVFPPARDGGMGRGIEAQEGIEIPRDGLTPRAMAPGALPAVAQDDDIVLFAYGARRAIGPYRPDLRQHDRQTHDLHVNSLVSATASLAPPEQLFADPGGRAARRQLIDTVNALMPPDTVVLGDVDGAGRLLVKSRGLEVPWTLLSDGAQSYMAWLFDLLYWLPRWAPDGDARSVRGTVLIDEVDQRMHPRWQQTLLEQLSGGLPNLQFICSAHSPLVAGGLRSENLTLLEPDPDAPGQGAMEATRLVEDLYGRTADGVLSSSYFNLTSSRSERFRDELTELAEAGRDHDEAALAFIRALTAGSAGTPPRARSPLLDRPDRFRNRRS